MAESPGRFRLLNLLDPFYLISRLSRIRSFSDAAGRAWNILRYIGYLGWDGYYAVKGVFIRLMRAGFNAVFFFRGMFKSLFYLVGRILSRAAGAVLFGGHYVHDRVNVFCTGHFYARAREWVVDRFKRPYRFFIDAYMDFRLQRGLSQLMSLRVSEKCVPRDNDIPDVPLNALWILNSICNYKCPYCRVSEEARALPPVALRPEEYALCWERFNQRYGPAHIEVHGGEPFIFPDFPDILSAISVRNTVDVITNLSWEPQSIVGRLDPKKVWFTASYHPEHEASPARFIGKVKAIRRAGFYCMVVIVAWPPYLRRIPAWLREFYQNGIYVLVHPFYGSWGGRNYPSAYTDFSFRFIKSAGDGDYISKLSESNEISDRITPGMLERLHMSMSGPLSFQACKTSPRGKLCAAGSSYLRIRANGDITRCMQGADLGNLYRGDFRLLDGHAPCEFDVCASVAENMYMEGASRGPAAPSAVCRGDFS